MNIIIQAILVLISLVPAQQDTAAEPLPPVEQLVEEALERNPRIEVFFARIEAQEQRVSRAGVLPDPVVGVTALNFPVALNPLHLSREPMTQLQASYAQTFPAEGTRRWREEVQRRKVAVARRQLQAERLTIAGLVRVAALQYAFAWQQLHTEELSRPVYEQFLENARTKYRTGTGKLPDVLRAQIELSNLEARLRGRQEAVEQAAARLNVLLDRPADARLGVPGALSDDSVAAERGALLRQALEANPAFDIIRADLETTEAEIALAETRLKPDTTVRFAYGLRHDRVDFWTAGVSINLPLWRDRNQRTAIAEKQAEKRLNETMLRVRENEVDLGIQQALVSMRSAADQLQAYRSTIIPQARTALDAAVAGYRADSSDFLTMLDIQKQLIRLQLTVDQLQYEKQLAAARIEEITGSVPGYREDNYE